MSLFQKSIEKKYLNDLDSTLIDKKYAVFKDYFANPERQENIRNSKEEQFQEGFLRELFVKILGYTLNPEPGYNLTTELKNIANSKKADGAILLTGEHAPQSVIAVIELKGTDTTDLDKIETQAFGYKNHHPKCEYVITSNFGKLRFYIQNAVDHIDFDLFNLSKEQFSLLWLCLAKDNLLTNLPLKLKESSVLQEENITKKLYADYSKFREAIFNNLVKNNPETDKILLFKKTQKLLDRFLFIFFAEDRLLLPPNSIGEIVKQWTTLKEELDEYFPLYTRFKKYFGYMNTGFKGKKYDIYAYNGGLFKPDEILDNITIDDDILHEHTLRLSNYDFETDVDVNILGHIFEHSLGEIENVQAEIARTAEQAPLHLAEQKEKKGEHAPHTTSKRKKDGIFYTPKYITKYIVENTVGKLCEEKRSTLGIIDEEYTKGRKNRKKDRVKSLDKKLDDYRNWLLSLTILDPACGSGAFLNQALEFLINEHSKIDELREQLLGGSIIFSDITTDILEKNIYGVDLNEESVDIAKLSLWLRTAQKGRKLNSLSNNIKCGNSLIDDPEVAGEKAFNWQKEFPNIFHKKNKKAYHVTTATHNSRYSQRMFDNHVKLGEPVWLSEKEEIIVSETIAEIAEKDKLNIIAFNICGDHAHILLVCEEEELPKIVQKIKSMSARACNIAMGRTIPMEAFGEHTSAHSAETPPQYANPPQHASTAEHAPLHVAGTIDTGGEHAPHPEQENTGTTPQHAAGYSAESRYKIGEHAPRGETQFHLWAAKFDQREITSEEQLQNTITYIRNNRKKHQQPENKGVSSLVDKMTCSPQHAFRKEYSGGFDVVIGNPPYVRAELHGDFRGNLEANYTVYNPAGDLFSYFYEKSFKLLKTKGLFGFISNTFDKTTAGISIRDYLQNEVQFLKYIDFTEVQIFEGATTYPVIIIAKNQKETNQPFTYIKIPKASQSVVIDIDFHDSVIVSQNLLNKENWSFKSNQSVGLVEKLQKNKTIREIYGKCYYGVKTALNEAFIIPKSYQTGKHVKSIFEGKELEKWSIPESVQQLILFESKWTKE
ncbi:MAG: N-6 DNA methylase, partial [Bacteroidales bacterium]|nr:N-6 DNA methylase [Bacteroidales bacterium]